MVMNLNKDVGEWVFDIPCFSKSTQDPRRDKNWVPGSFRSWMLTGLPYPPKKWKCKVTDPTTNWLTDPPTTQLSTKVAGSITSSWSTRPSVPWPHNLITFRSISRSRLYRFIQIISNIFISCDLYSFSLNLHTIKPIYIHLENRAQATPPWLPLHPSRASKPHLSQGPSPFAKISD